MREVRQKEIRFNHIIPGYNALRQSQDEERKSHTAEMGNCAEGKDGGSGSID